MEVLLCQYPEKHLSNEVKLEKSILTMTTQTEVPTITHIWARFNLRWIICGILSGVLAGLLIAIITMPLAASRLGEATAGLKYIGAVFFGREGTRFGPMGASGFAGLVLHLSLSALYGAVFAQLISEKSKPLSLIILSVVTSMIIWVFGCMLFMPAFNLPFREILSPILAIFLHIGFGLSFGVILNILRNKILED